MPLLSLDHVNLRTARLHEMRAFYSALPGLREGQRPPFSFDGAWIYCGDRAVIHLVAVDVAETSSSGGDLSLEHFALTAVGFREFVEGLRSSNLPHRIGIVPGSGTRQVNLHDPDGNHFHVDFAADDMG
jgi:catechol 2,3-dioxygenase-like lactoylglutathione lyase family enzyme